MPDENCEMCQAVSLAKAGQNPRLVHEFENAYLLVGSHQRFAGYCVLVAKEHTREPFDLPESSWAELMRSARAIDQAFKPHKINYGCYGNQVPHVHWHIFPRYAGDPMLKAVPWMQSADFDGALTTPEQAQDVIARVSKSLRDNAPQ